MSRRSPRWSLLLLAGLVWLSGCAPADTPKNTRAAQHVDADVEASRSDDEAYRIACDPDIDTTTRFAAVAQLNAAEKARLNRELSDQVRNGGIDVRCLHNIQVLGEVGDAETLEVFAKFEIAAHLPGKIDTAISQAIDRIKARITEEEKFPLGPRDKRPAN